MIDFGSVIRRIRNEMGISQKDLAHRLGVSPTYVSLIEGNKKEPSITLIKHFSAVSDIPIEILLWTAIDCPTTLSKDEVPVFISAKSIAQSYVDSVFRTA